jgi:hypothetical protein
VQDIYAIPQWQNKYKKLKDHRQGKHRKNQAAKKDHGKTEKVGEVSSCTIRPFTIKAILSQSLSASSM